MAHPQNPSPTRQSQDDSARTAPRKCLLKGCDRYFPTNHPLDRYCNGECQQAARRWSIAKANLNYRASENGKQKRREQAARYAVLSDTIRYDAALISRSLMGLTRTTFNENGILGRTWSTSTMTVWATLLLAICLFINYM